MQTGQKDRIWQLQDYYVTTKTCHSHVNMYRATGIEGGLMTQPISTVHKWVMSE